MQKVSLFFLLFIVSTAAFGAANAPAPTHVKVLKIDTTLSADGSSVQTVHVENEADSDAAVRLDGQAMIPYVMSYQTVDIVEAFTRKPDGRTIPVDASAIYDQLPQGAPGAPVITDLHAKTILFPQFAAGDTAVYTARITAKHQIFPNQYWTGQMFPKEVAYDDVQETLTVPANLVLYVENNGVSFDRSRSGSQSVYRWQYHAPSSLTPEVATVDPVAYIPHYFVSTFPDYAALGRAYAEAATPQAAVTPQIKALAEEITKGTRDRRAIVRAIYEWVSTHIRYVAVELGKGSIIPHAADTVVANGYGDCKDQVVLMQALLKAENVESEAVLLDALPIYALTKVPTFAGLNHVITFVPGLDLFLDSTTGISPLGVLPFAEYGKPAVFASTSAPRLGATPVLPTGMATLTTKTVAHVDKDGVLSGTTTTTGTGPYAIQLHAIALAAQTVGAEIAGKAMLQRDGFGGDATGNLDISAPLVADDSYGLSGTFIVSDWQKEAAGTESFYLPGGMRLAGVSGDGLMGSFFDTSKEYAAMEIPCYSAEATEDLSLEAPPGKHFSSAPADTHVHTANILFDSQWTRNGGTMSVHRHFVSTINQPLCTAAVRSANAEAIRSIAESYNLQVSFAREASDAETDWYASNIAGPPKDPALAAAMTGVLAAMRNHNDAEAIAQLSAILAKPDLPVSVSFPARYDLALLYARDFRSGEALADLDAALAVKPHDARMLVTRAHVWFGRADFARALADCQTVLAEHRSDATALHLRANVEMETGRYEDAIHDYTSELAVVHNLKALVLRAVAYHRIGRDSDAVADIDLAEQGGAKGARQYYDTITGTPTTDAVFQTVAASPAAPLLVQSTASTLAAPQITDRVSASSGAPDSRPTWFGANTTTYPPLSLLLEETGRVSLGFDVDANGNVSNAKIERSSGFPVLDAAAVAALNTWRYNPARHEGRAIPRTAKSR